MVQSSWQFYKQLNTNSQLLNDNYDVSLFVVQTQVGWKAILISGDFFLTLAKSGKYVYKKIFA